MDESKIRRGGRPAAASPLDQAIMAVAYHHRTGDPRRDWAPRDLARAFKVSPASVRRYARRYGDAPDPVLAALQDARREAAIEDELRAQEQLMTGSSGRGRGRPSRADQLRRWVLKTVGARNPAAALAVVVPDLPPRAEPPPR